MARNPDRGGRPARLRRDARRAFERIDRVHHLEIGAKEADEWSLTTLRVFSNLLIEVADLSARVRELEFTLKDQHDNRE